MWRLLTGRVLRREGHTVKKTVRRAALLALLLGLLCTLALSAVITVADTETPAPT